MQQLGSTMTAQEFGQHYALEQEEPLPAAVLGAVSRVLAGLANGPLKQPAQGRNWATHDFMPTLWADIQGDDLTPPEPKELTVDEIMARARMAGMVH